MTVPADGIERLMYFVDARIAQLQLTKADIERRGGPSRDTLTKLRGRSGSTTPLVGTLLRYDDALGWYPGSAAVTLLGGQPLSRTASLKRRKKPATQPLSEDQIAAHLTGLLSDEIASLETRSRQPHPAHLATAAPARGPRRRMGHRPGPGRRLCGRGRYAPPTRRRPAIRRTTSAPDRVMAGSARRAC